MSPVEAPTITDYTAIALILDTFLCESQYPTKPEDNEVDALRWQNLPDHGEDEMFMDNLFDFNAASGLHFTVDSLAIEEETEALEVTSNEDEAIELQKVLYLVAYSPVSHPIFDHYSVEAESGFIPTPLQVVDYDSSSCSPALTNDSEVSLDESLTYPCTPSPPPMVSQDLSKTLKRSRSPAADDMQILPAKRVKRTRAVATPSKVPWSCKGGVTLREPAPGTKWVYEKNLPEHIRRIVLSSGEDLPEGSVYVSTVEKCGKVDGHLGLLKRHIHETEQHSEPSHQCCIAHPVRPCDTSPTKFWRKDGLKKHLQRRGVTSAFATDFDDEPYRISY